MPKVSVIIPVYNVEKYLNECLDSVVNQTLKDIEIICVNDGSTDNSLSILQEYAKNDERVKIADKQNGGYGQAMNFGLSNATGDFIGIVEPDDYIALNMYEDLYNLATENNADIVKSPFFENFDTPKKKEISKINWNKSHKLPNKIFSLEECPLFLFFHPSVWSCIYKKTFLEENNIKFIEAKGAGWTDNPFQVETMISAKRIFYTGKAYYYWRIRNINPSDDLRDYTLPFVRSDEIHAFLDTKQNINPEIINCLLKREIAYLTIVLGVKNIKNKTDYYEKIKSMCRRIYKNLSLPSEYITKKDLNNLSKIYKHPYIMRFCYRFKAERKNLFSLHLTKNDFKFRFLNLSYCKKFEKKDCYGE